MRSILHVADAASIHTRRWAETQRNQGVQVHIASFREAAIPGVAVHVLPTFGLGRAGYLLSVPALRSLARRIRPDVVHAQHLTSYGFVSALAKLHPLVLTAWGSDVLIAPKQSRLFRLMVQYAIGRADRVTTVAEHMNSAVAALRKTKEPVVAVPFGVDVERFVPPSASRSVRDGLRLICTRNFAPIYDVGTLISAVHLLSGKGVVLHVDLVGDGPLRAAIEAQVDKAGLRGMVEFHGHIAHAQLPGLLAQADIFVTPARSDGNNVSLTEAMACGCFPIATDIEANAQWIKNGENGLLYPAGNSGALAECIDRAIADPAWRARAVKTNREIIERRADWRVCVARMNDIYASAMARTGSKK